MKKIISFILIVFVHFPSFSQTTLLDNINGYTLDEVGNLIQFSAIQFTDDKVDQLFSSNSIQPKKGVQIIDGQGKTLLPGLIDAHGHVLSYGLSLMQVNLNGVLSEQAAVKRAIEYHQKNNASQWLLGRGWNQVLWTKKQYPQAISLDEYFKNTPIWFKRVDGHAGWANSKAMQLAGVDHTSVSPDGGEIIKDAKNKKIAKIEQEKLVKIEVEIKSEEEEREIRPEESREQEKIIQPEVEQEGEQDGEQDEEKEEIKKEEIKKED